MYTYDGYTEIGSRSCNEDSVYMGSNKLGDTLLAIADGLGGHGGGDEASAAVIRSLSSCFLKGEYDIAQTISDINAAILELQQETSIKCKSTIAMILLTDGRTIAATVGDTRIYAFKNRGIVFQSTDHSGAQLAVSVGEITPDRIRGHEDRSILTRALGAGETVKADITEIPDDYDALLLCSDGFWERITEQQMLDCLAAAESAADWLTRMIKEARRSTVSEPDNSSAIVLIKTH
ncbi:MAG: PP2C family protein-serine/threonine phosphatase [Oscillospiraceae bacterium]